MTGHVLRAACILISERQRGRRLSAAGNVRWPGRYGSGLIEQVFNRRHLRSSAANGCGRISWM